MRALIDLLTETTVPADKAAQILSDRRCKRGVKLGQSARLWRGQSEQSGHGMATYGLGYYFTADKRTAEDYAGDDGEVVEVSRTMLPDNPLRFETRNDFQIWLQQAQRLLGYPSNLEFAKDYHDFGDFIRALDPSIDGIQMFTGRDSIFVLYGGPDTLNESKIETIDRHDGEQVKIWINPTRSELAESAVYPEEDEFTEEEKFAMWGSRMGTKLDWHDRNNTGFRVIKHDPAVHTPQKPLVLVIHPGDMIVYGDSSEEGREASRFGSANIRGTTAELKELLRGNKCDFAVLHRGSCAQFPGSNPGGYRDQLWKLFQKGHKRGTVMFGDKLDRAGAWIIRNLHIAERPHVYLLGAYSDPLYGCLTEIGQQIERVIGPDRITVSEYSPVEDHPEAQHTAWRPGKKLSEGADIPQVMIVTHPGSCCGSANDLLGRMEANGGRDDITFALNKWQGGVIVVDGDLSDELPSYPGFDRAIKGALSRAAAAGLPSMRVFACDDLTPNWPKKVKRAIAALGLRPGTHFVVTGAWYLRNGEAGCVNAVYDEIAELGFPVEVHDSAIVDPDYD